MTQRALEHAARARRPRPVAGPSGAPDASFTAVDFAWRANDSDANDADGRARGNGHVRLSRGFEATTT